MGLWMLWDMATINNSNKKIIIQSDNSMVTINTARMPSPKGGRGEPLCCLDYFTLNTLPSMSTLTVAYHECGAGYCGPSTQTVAPNTLDEPIGDGCQTPSTSPFFTASLNAFLVRKLVVQ